MRTMMRPKPMSVGRKFSCRLLPPPSSRATSSRLMCANSGSALDKTVEINVESPITTQDLFISAARIAWTTLGNAIQAKLRI